MQCLKNLRSALDRLSSRYLLYHRSTTKPQPGWELQGATSVQMNTRRAQRILQPALQRKPVPPTPWETRPSSEKHPGSTKYINASVRAHLSDGTPSHPAHEIRDAHAIGLGAGPTGDTDGLGGDHRCIPTPAQPQGWAMLSISWSPVSSSPPQDGG